ncbi:hypothetical protein FG379_001451 [Cryptosporidium bovis]|uniref:uncharacterized protein n=1 Tax=Cryptosporidium bovis TaxID=310047 RepID=UPI00351AA2DC|nr:hypothetical protein FG379_001451 [Cryptosporidium bovis]
MKNKNEAKIYDTIEPLCSIKPINAILKTRFEGQNMLIIGYGNEIRIYSDDLDVLYCKELYHDSHNVYGIYEGKEDNIISVVGLSTISWYKVSSKNKSDTIGNEIDNEIRNCITMIKVNESRKNDLFLASIDIGFGKWISGTSRGVISLFKLEREINEPIDCMVDYKIESCPTVYCMKISNYDDKNNNKIMIIAGSAFSTVNIWNMEIDTGKITEKQVLKGHNGVVYDILLSPCKKTIISCSDDRKILVWKSKSCKSDQNSFKLVYYLIGHKAIIWSIDCYWDEQIIASLSEDGCLNVWNLNDEEKSDGGILFPKEKVSNAHQGRGGRIVKFIGNYNSEFIFASGGEGGDLKIWRYSTLNGNMNDNNSFTEKKSFHSSTEYNLQIEESNLTPMNLQDTNNCNCIHNIDGNNNWFQGAYLININELLCVTRGGLLQYAIKLGIEKDGEKINSWKKNTVHYFEDLIYSMSVNDILIFSLGSSKGKLIHGQFDLTNKGLLWKNETVYQNWDENVTFVKICEIIKEELYLTLSSCSKGIVGASISKPTYTVDDNIIWISEVVPIIGTPKYGEIKCLDIVSHTNSNQSGNTGNGKIVCGTVTGNIFVLEYSVNISKGNQTKNEFTLKLLSSLNTSHKGNVSSLMWISDIVGNFGFISTGQDAKINSYNLSDKIELKWVHKWKSKCDYVVKCIKIGKTNNWLLIGAIKHNLCFFHTRESLTSTPMLVFQHKFGGIKRSFQINSRNISGNDIIEIIWCDKPSIKIIQINTNYLLSNIDRTFIPITTLRSLYSSPPSRLIYSLSWIDNSKFLVGGEDHILRIFDVSNCNVMNLIYSVRLLDPIRKIKVLKVTGTFSIVLICGGRRMLHIFELSTSSNNKLEMRLVFSNNVNKFELNSRFISLDAVLISSKKELNEYNSSKSIENSEKMYKDDLVVFVGSSKGELIAFNFELIIENKSKLNLKLKKKLIETLQFVPLSLGLDKSIKDKTLFIGLSNGCIRAYEYNLSSLESVENFMFEVKFKYEIKVHTSGVNSILIINLDLFNKGNIIVTSGHDQKISVLSANCGNLLSSISNAHFSSIRDLCFDCRKNLIFSISWDQKLGIYHVSETSETVSVQKVNSISIPIWDSSKFIIVNLGLIYRHV